MKILVTGGAGYLGSVLTEHLLASGHNVTVLDNFMYGQSSLGHLCRYHNLEIIRGDIRRLDVLTDALKTPDIIIPLAAIVGAPACDNDEGAAEDTNLNVILASCNLMSPSQQLVIPITNSGYGVGEAGKECDETSSLKPLSLYGRLKVAAEEAALNRENSVSLRLATVFGMSPRMRLDLLVNDFVYRAVRDHALVLFEGHFKRNYIHVRDVAQAFIHTLNNFDAMKGQAYNVGLSDANLSKLELCEQIKKHAPDFYYTEAAVGEDPDKRDYIVSNKKFEATGWLPEWSLDRGIVELIKGYQMLRNSRYGNV